MLIKKIFFFLRGGGGKQLKIREVVKSDIQVLKKKLLGGTFYRVGSHERRSSVVQGRI